MTDFTTALEPAEKAILDSIELDQLKLDGTADSNGHAVLALMKLLIKRNAIPAIHVRYWQDPEYRDGRVKASHKGLFGRNGTEGDEIYEHPNFLSYLRYFIYGADLPSRVIAAFVEKVGNPEWVSLSDSIPLGKFARALARDHGLNATGADEFFKLSLDLGLYINTAKGIRDAVKQLRR
jgi:hypothetical protein